MADKYLVRGAWLVVAAACISCSGAAQSSKKKKQVPEPVPPPTFPLPTAGLAGQNVALYPLTLVAAEDSLHWDSLVTNRRATLTKADTVIVGLLTSRAPELIWILPDDLRKAAKRAVGIATDPDKMGSSVLRDEGIHLVPAPLSTQLRALTALADARFALVPAALIYRKYKKRTPEAPDHVATAELSIALVDVRKNTVEWRTIARGDGSDPWTALTAAVKGLTPGLP